MTILKPEWNKNREAVLKDRYLYKDEEKWEDIVRRINDNVNVDIYKELKSFKFVPAGRMLAGIGTNTTKTFFNCYVLGFKNIDNKGIDSRKAISNLFERAFEISARGGGIGINWSVLRPNNSRIKKVNGKSTGPLAFMESLNSLIESVSQGGSRRGAQMYGLETWHPDIIDFIKIKNDLTKINSANLSVFVSDKFMKAVKKDKDWQLIFPDTTYKYYDEEWNGDINEWKDKDYPIIHYDTIKARTIFNKITKYAHDTGEPGMIFLDRANKYNIPNKDEKLISTNPCAEEPLSENSVCNLGAINLTRFVDFDTKETNYNKLKNTIHKSVEFLDEIIDINPYYQKETKEHQNIFRKIGLGFMGLADYFILKDIEYGSLDSFNELEKIMKFISNESFRKSALLAKEKGKAPIWKDYMLQNKYIQQLDDDIYQLVQKYGLRNTRILTIAPTGSTAVLAGVSSGIEPNFAYEMERDDRIGKREDIHWIYPQREKLGIDEDIFIEASDLSYKRHIRMQSIAQKYIDASISKTINAPEDSTIKDTEDAFMFAYDTGCKGITYYRDGSRTGVLKKLNKEDKENGISELENKFKEAGEEVIPNDVKIPKEPPVKLYKRKDNNGKKWYFFIAFADRNYTRPFALFIKTNNYTKGDVADWTISKIERLVFSKGIDEEIIEEQTKKYSGQSNPDKIARAIGLALRHNIKLKDIVNVLDSCEPEFSSLLFHIKKLLSNFIPNGTKTGENCPLCGADVIYKETCIACSECYWTKC